MLIPGAFFDKEPAELYSSVLTNPVTRARNAFRNEKGGKSKGNQDKDEIPPE